MNKKLVSKFDFFSFIRNDGEVQYGVTIDLSLDIDYYNYHDAPDSITIYLTLEEVKQIRKDSSFIIKHIKEN